MSISSKIEEIRQKPEHIRMRYVWGCVAISMVFIVAIWVFSLSAQKFEVSQSETTGAIGLYDEFQTQKASLDQYKNQMGEIKSNVEKSLEIASQAEQASTQSDLTTLDYPNIPSASSGSEGFSGGFPISPSTNSGTVTPKKPIDSGVVSGASSIK